jgi:hypothetical protein
MSAIELLRARLWLALAGTVSCGLAMVPAPEVEGVEEDGGDATVLGPIGVVSLPWLLIKLEWMLN